ncbi:SUKH-4 family immunity protein [Micromonosporaceae bacterium DT55]|uniref:SUKH-4 family immunity protein n=1 Tax=Melissospora conviva TaxID=3388432 RepID=UPI003C1AB5E1
MTPNHDQLHAAFDHWGLEITRATPEGIEGKVSSEEARNVLLQIGLPERLGDYYFFHDLSKGCLTLREALRTPPEGIQDLVYLGSGPDEDTLLLDGTTGEVFSWRGEDLLKVNSSLSILVHFLYLIQLELNRMEEGNVMAESDLQRTLEQTLARLQAADRESSAETSDYWRQFLAHTV